MADVQEYLAPTINLPDRVTAVVGDTLQLFYRGSIVHPNPYIYDIAYVCDVGRNTPRYFEVTPTAAQVGNHTLTALVKDHRGNILATKECVLRIVNKATSPVSNKYILCVGDSLTVGGGWVNETARRLTGTGGAPAGDGLSNINFIGTVTSKLGSAAYEGYGGWTWANYLNRPQVTNLDMWVYCAHDKDITDQHSLWEDENGNIWQLETLESSRLKFTRYENHTGTLPGSGMLVHYRNAQHTEVIIYTSTQVAGGNPFWDSATDSLNFKSYAERNGWPRIDIMYTLLTWNSLNATSQVTQASEFFRTFHAQYPNAKVKLMGIQIPSINGGTGANYGAAGTYSQWYELARFVATLNNAFQNLANSDEFSSYVEFVNVATQFDSEYNMPQSLRNVNTRNSNHQERIGTNGVHPTTEGYYQIADIAYRNLTAYLN